MQLASLRNTHLSEKISISIAEFAQAEFLGRRDPQGKFWPDEVGHLTEKAWLQRNSLAHGSLMAKGCECVGILAEHPQPTIDRLYRIGSNFALALQAFNEVEPYAEGSNHLPLMPDGETMDLGAAPVLFHLDQDPEMLELIRRTPRLTELDSTKIYQTVKEGPGVAKAKRLAHKLSGDCLADIEALDDSDAKGELVKMVTYIHNFSR